MGREGRLDPKKITRRRPECVAAREAGNRSGGEKVKIWESLRVESGHGDAKRRGLPSPMRK